MRRGLGKAAILEQQAKSKRQAEVGQQVQSELKQQTQAQFLNFKQKLQEFATKYRGRINSDKEFRKNFLKMCYTLGVDPLQGSKAFWGGLNLNQFYSELGLQVLHICLALRKLNGGVIEINKCKLAIEKMRNASDVTDQDIEKSVSQLSLLGPELKVIDIKGQKYILSVSEELDSDSQDLISISTLPYIEYQMIQSKGWDIARFHKAVKVLINEGVVWWDRVDDRYYFLSRRSNSQPQYFQIAFKYQFGHFSRQIILRKFESIIFKLQLNKKIKQKLKLKF